VISRFGGDEFVILQAPILSLEQGEALATRVSTRSAAPTISTATR
jgi:GGDEF domain-containing protein